MRLYSFVAAAALATASFTAHADTITQNFSQTYSFTADQSNDPYTVNLMLNQFNSALGTLTSVSGTLSGSATTPAGSNIIYVNDFRTDTLVQFYTRSASFNVSADGTLTGAADLNADIGSGTAPFTFNVGLENGIPDASSAGTISGTITYNYTPTAVPVAATPEPSSLALLGTGLLGAIGVMRKRFA